MTVSLIGRMRGRPHGPRRGRRLTGSSRGASASKSQRLSLRCEQFGATGFGKIHECVELLAREGALFAGALYLDKALVRGHDEVCIDLGGGIFRIVEIEHRRSLKNAA